MSTIKVNDIQEATSGGGKIWPSRVWINWTKEGGDVINADGNVSSITDHSTGNTTISFSNALTDADYSFTGMCKSEASDNVARVLHVRDDQPPTSSTLRVVSAPSSSGNVKDVPIACISIAR